MTLKNYQSYIKNLSKIKIRNRIDFSTAQKIVPHLNGVYSIVWIEYYLHFNIINLTYSRF